MNNVAICQDLLISNTEFKKNQKLFAYVYSKTNKRLKMECYLKSGDQLGLYVPDF